MGICLKTLNTYLSKQVYNINWPYFRLISDRNRNPKLRRLAYYIQLFSYFYIVKIAKFIYTKKTIKFRLEIDFLSCMQICAKRSSYFKPTKLTRTRKITNLQKGLFLNDPFMLNYKVSKIEFSHHVKNWNRQSFCNNLLPSLRADS